MFKNRTEAGEKLGRPIKGVVLTIFILAALGFALVVWRWFGIDFTWIWKVIFQQ